ncbi:polyhydroxyalkanoic acid system family protein [Patescibacteria group bacterium]|nr:polyhydroxyalkanoic acid system family protein [Patescibacteria group bacterium]
MATINLELQHSLTEQEALKRIKKLSTEIQDQYGDKMSEVNESWKGNKGAFSFSTKGYNISGTIEVKKYTILIHGDIPWSLGLFKGKIEKTIRDRAQILLQ